MCVKELRKKKKKINKNNKGSHWTKKRFSETVQICRCGLLHAHIVLQ
jgi:CDGSH-type Zn-finger protein